MTLTESFRLTSFAFVLIGAVISTAILCPAGENSVRRCVVVWSEGTAPTNVYPKDINSAIAEGLKIHLKDWDVVTASINDADQGLPDSLLNRADVLIWWGHKKHGTVKDDLVTKIEKRVKDDGMGFISLHSSHFAKINKKLMGTPCSWKAYVGDSTTLTITAKDGNHPIAKGIPKDFRLTHNERYSDPYAVPEAKSIVFEGVADLRNGGKDASKQGFCWDIGKGKMSYFQPGHETNPIFYDENVRKIISNAVLWSAPERK